MRPAPGITPDGFDRLLGLLDADRERAGEEYERMRLVLVKFFDWRKCGDPQHLVDEAMDRVARQLEAGAEIRRPRAYFLGVAHRIALECAHSVDRRMVSVDDRFEAVTDPDGDPGAALDRRRAERDLALRVSQVRRCLGLSPPESRMLFVRYYRCDGPARREERKRMATELGISVNALRIRVHRIGEALAACVAEALEGSVPA